MPKFKFNSEIIIEAPTDDAAIVLMEKLADQIAARPYVDEITFPMNCEEVQAKTT